MHRHSLHPFGQHSFWFGETTILTTHYTDIPVKLLQNLAIIIELIKKKIESAHHANELLKFWSLLNFFGNSFILRHLLKKT